MHFTQHNQNGLVYLTAPTISCTHAFTTRFGGVSEGIWESLNLGENRGDAPEKVRENYRRLGEALDFAPEKLVFTRQVHTDIVRTVTAADAHALFTPVPYEADGLVTNQRDLPLIIFIADCVPVLLCDPVHGVIGAVHCGWRSSVMDILGKAVPAMEALGARAEDICAAIGPSIGACCFETGPEVPEAVENWLGGDGAAFYRPEPGVPGKFLVDLRGANRQRLLQLGLPGENIAVTEECTMCSPDKYWSHRVTKGNRGSQAAVILLK